MDLSGSGCWTSDDDDDDDDEEEEDASRLPPARLAAPSRGRQRVVAARKCIHPLLGSVRSGSSERSSVRSSFCELLRAQYLRVYNNRIWPTARSALFRRGLRAHANQCCSIRRNSAASQG